MKKYFFTVIFALFTGLFASAQDLNSLMNEVAKSENAKREVGDGAAIVGRMKTFLEKDTTGMMARLLPVMQKIDSAMTVSIQSPDSVATELIKNYKLGVGDSIIKVTDKAPAYIRTIVHKEGDSTTEVFLLYVIDAPYNAGAIFKYSGKFNEADLREMATNKFMGN